MLRSVLENLLLTLLLAGFFAPSLAAADTVHQVSVVVNQLDNANVPNIRNRQKAMNTILKACEAHKIFIRYTITKTKLNQDPQKNGNSVAPNGNIPDDDATDELSRQAKLNEIKNGGLKVWLANSVTSDGDAVNGIAGIGGHTCMIKEQSGIDGDERTWAHELGHALGLRHATAGGDEDNLMFGSRRKASPPAPANTPSGSELTMAQCTTLEAAMKRRSPTTSKTPAQKNEPKARGAATTTPDDPAGDPPTLAKEIDIAYGVFGIDADMFQIGQKFITLEMQLLEPPSIFPSPNQYLVLMDLDDNPATGDPGGFDAVVEMQLLDPAFGQMNLLALPGFQLLDTQPLLIEGADLEKTGPTSGGIEPGGITLLGQFPFDALLQLPLPPLAPQGVVLYAADDGSLFDDVGPDPIPLDIDLVPFPELVADPIYALPSQTIDLDALGFEPLEPYIVLFDDDIVASGTTDGTGALSETILLPSPPFGHYLFDVITDAGSTAIDVVRVVPEPSFGVALAAGGLFLGVLGRAGRDRKMPQEQNRE